MTDAVTFGLLGALEIHHAGRRIALRAGRQRAVLALMLLQPHQDVTVESLIKRLWDGEPPDGGRNTVQAYVARLRRALREATGQDDLIRTGPGGYTLAVADEQVDLARFRALAAAGERGIGRGELPTAAGALRAALDLWRGAALQDVPCESLQRDEAPALEDERLHAVERLCDTELLLGRPAAALALLRPLVAERPLRERPWCQLITALYRCGRRAEALTAYHDIARVLYTELGVEPGPDLREVHQSVLDDVAGDVVWPPQRERGPARTLAEPRREVWAEPRQLPASPPELAGRDNAVHEAARLLTSPPAPGSVPVVVLTGTPGAGKTALAVTVAHRLAARFPDGQIFLPLTSADGSPRGPGVLLADALRSTGADPEAVSRCPHARAAALRDRFAGRRVLLVLDDATDAEQIIPLLPGDAGCAALVTARTELPALTAFHGARRLVLDALDPPAAVELLARILGPDRIAAEPLAAAELAALCGHLPPALCVAAASLAGRRFTSLTSYVTELRAGDRLTLLYLRDTFDRVYGALPGPARRLYRLLGAAPDEELDIPEAADLAGWPLQETAACAQHLIAAHLVAEDAPDRLRLSGLARVHAADRACAEGDLAAPALAMTHRPAR